MWIHFGVEECRIQFWVTLSLISGIGLRKFMKKICSVLSNNFPQVSCMLDSFPLGICHITDIDYNWSGINLRLKIQQHKKRTRVLPETKAGLILIFFFIITIQVHTVMI